MSRAYNKGNKYINYAKVILGYGYTVALFIYFAQGIIFTAKDLF